jgi:hypothetical protein
MQGEEKKGRIEEGENGGKARIILYLSYKL